MTAASTRRRVAIACQGGGSHTAFTAGVLGRLLQPDVTEHVDVVALSGTSGGAICATLAWSALLDGDPTLAQPRLEQFWQANSASTPWEQLLNSSILAANKLADYVAMPAVSPYDNPGAAWGLDYFRKLLLEAIDFERLTALAADSAAAPVLLLGGVDVLTGDFHAFDSRNNEITADAILASAAIPTLYQTIHVGGGAYWDGLFSQNPPVHDLLDVEPDEIWVIQINPKVRATEPRSMTEIADRRNELSGNLSLYQELRHIEEIDRLIEDGFLVGSRYRPTTLRVMEMERSPRSQSQGTVSKLNRDPAFLTELIGLGAQRAEVFAASLLFERAWQAGDSDAMLEFFAEDCEVSSSPPFTEVAPTRSRDATRAFVTKRLTDRTSVDLTRTQVASDRIEWCVRATAARGNQPIEGTAQVEIRDGSITGFHLRPTTS